MRIVVLVAVLGLLLLGCSGATSVEVSGMVAYPEGFYSVQNTATEGALCAPGTEPLFRDAELEAVSMFAFISPLGKTSTAGRYQGIIGPGTIRGVFCVVPFSFSITASEVLTIRVGECGWIFNPPMVSKDDGLYEVDENWSLGDWEPGLLRHRGIACVSQPWLSEASSP